MAVPLPSRLTLLRFLSALAVVALALWLLDGEALLAAASRISAATIALLALLIVIVHVILAWRWHTLVAPFSQLTWRDTLGLYFFANFFNSFSPANIGGDVYRAAAQCTDRSVLARILEALLRERVLGLTSYILGAVLGAALVVLGQGGLPSPGRELVMLALLGGVGLLAVTASARPLAVFLQRRLTHPRLWPIERAASLVAAALHFTGWGRYAILLAQSMLAWALWIGALYATVLALGLELGLAETALVGSLTEIIRLLPISLQGIGVRESSFSYLAFLLGAGPEAAFAVSAIAYAVLSLILLASGPLALALGHRPLDTARLRRETRERITAGEGTPTPETTRN